MRFMCLTGIYYRSTFMPVSYNSENYVLITRSTLMMKYNDLLGRCAGGKREGLRNTGVPQELRSKELVTFVEELGLTSYLVEIYG